jgi:sugar phosphate permease
VLLLAIAAVLIYLLGEVTIDWIPIFFGLSTMLILYFAQSKPDFQPFRWWALAILPLAAFISPILGVPADARAPVTSITFGLVLFCGAVVRLTQLRRYVDLT